MVRGKKKGREGERESENVCTYMYLRERVRKRERVDAEESKRV